MCCQKATYFEMFYNNECIAELFQISIHHKYQSNIRPRGIAPAQVRCPVEEMLITFKLLFSACLRATT